MATESPGEDSRDRINAPRVVGEVIDGEAVIMHMDKGTYYNLNATGAFIWESIAKGLSSRQIIADCQRRFSGDAEAIAVAGYGFLERLREEDLISPDPSGAGAIDAGPAAAEGAARPVFTPPAIEVFTDLKELLLVDPIHEVDDRGWPHKKSATEP